MRRLDSVPTVSTAGVVAWVLGLMSGCGSPGQVGTPVQIGGGGAGSLNLKNDVNPSNGTDGTVSGAAPTGDSNCGNQTRGTSHVPADVLLVLDRSGSMEWSTAKDNVTCNSRDPNCTARWPALTAAVKTTLESTAGNISWGLKLFNTPNGKNGCTVTNAMEVNVSSASVPDIEAEMDAVRPGNYTPTEQAITLATAYLKTLQDQNNKVILLATDGEPNCPPGGGDNSTPNIKGTIAAIAAAKAAGFTVYVIGIGPSVGNLDSFAQAGGTQKYFPATSPEALSAAFSSISKAVTTCTFTSDQPAPDPNNVAVYLDRNLVARDESNGWSFGANSSTIVLNGSACVQVTSGAATKVQILYGCAGVAPPSKIY